MAERAHSSSLFVMALLTAGAAGAGCVRLLDSNDNPFHVPATCFNDTVDGNETDVDCGGSCGQCSSGEACHSSQDCAEGGCVAGRRRPSGSTCFDHATDGSETDEDCGGGCVKCTAGKACAVTTDCESGLCAGGLCGAGAGPFAFAPGRFAFAGRGATALVVADLDGDGKLDAATANEQDDNISVLGGAGDGTLRTGTLYAVGKQPNWIGAGDFNEDRRLDLVVLLGGGSGFRVLLGRGGLDFGGEAITVTSSTTNRPSSAAIADLDGDGHLDVVLASSAGQLTVFHGRGSGSFDGGGSFGAPQINPFRLAAADVDGDGRPDVATVGDPGVQVNLSGGRTLDVTVSLQPVNVSLPVLRAGGARDLVASGNDGEIAVLLGAGDGTFGAPALYRTGSRPFAVVSADFDGDGRPDLASCNQYSGDISLFAGHGDGTFEPAIKHRIGGSLQDMVAADMNGDGHPDLVVCDYGQHDVGVLLNVKK